MTSETLCVKSIPTTRLDMKKNRSKTGVTLSAHNKNTPQKQLFGGAVYKFVCYVCFVAQIRFCCESD